MVKIKVKAKKKGILLLLIHLLVLLIGLGLTIASLVMPWANASMLGLMTQIIYPYQNHSLQLVVLMPPFIIGMVFITGIYSFFATKRFVPGFVIFLLGASTVVLGIHLWTKIESNDVFFLGIDPLKLAEVHPDIGILMLILGGIILAVDGLIYLIKGIKG